MTIKVPTAIICEACSGTGAKPGSKPKPCGTCGGLGRVRAMQGFFTIERTCPTCQGRGEVIEDPCRVCSGGGRVTREVTLSVEIPAGVEDGTRMRLAGKGEAGARGAPPGDLYIFLSVKPHGFFSRDGADLFCRVPISMVSAALGTEIKVPTLDGREAVIKVPEARNPASSSASARRACRCSARRKGRSLCAGSGGDRRTSRGASANCCRNSRRIPRTQRRRNRPDSSARVKDFFGGAS